MEETIKKNLFRLYSKQGIKFTTLNEMFETIKIDQKTKLTCFYCQTELELSDSENELKRMSLDHKLPKYWGGENTIQNLVPCCLLCNTIKSTMQEQTYKQFLEALTKYEIKNKVFIELYPGQKLKNSKSLSGLV